MQRRLQPAPRAVARADLAAVVVDAKAHLRPAVVLAGLRPVDFVAAARAVLVRPQAAIGRQRGALAVAVAIAPDFGQRAGLADKRVVLRNCAVLGHAHHLAVVVVQGLRVVAARKAVTQREKQRAVGPLDDAATEMRRAAELGLLAEDDLHVLQPLRILRQPGTRQRRAVGRALAGLAEAKVDRAVAGKRGIGDHIQQTALPAGRHLGQALHGGLHLAVGVDHAQAAWPLGDQKAPVGKKRDRPGVLQAAGHRLRLGAGLRLSHAGGRRQRQQASQHEGCGCGGECGCHRLPCLLTRAGWHALRPIVCMSSPRASGRPQIRPVQRDADFDARPDMHQEFANKFVSRRHITPWPRVNPE